MKLIVLALLLTKENKHKFLITRNPRIFSTQNSKLLKITSLHNSLIKYIENYILKYFILFLLEIGKWELGVGAVGAVEIECLCSGKEHAMEIEHDNKDRNKEHIELKSLLRA